MIKSFIIATFSNWARLFKNFFISSGSIFLILESYEVLSNTDVFVSFNLFVVLSVFLTIVVFVFDGFVITGFYLNKVELFQNNFGTKVVIEFGDMFEYGDGWKVIGVNDFFDSKVDEKIISSSTLHGYVINNFWKNRESELDKKLKEALSEFKHIDEKRVQGKTKRYPIGTAVNVEAGNENFIFVALARTSVEDSLTAANAEDIISAVRGALRKARVVCANQPLVLPLLGSGLARVGIANKVLLDLIICGIFEEIKLGKISDVITIVIHPNKRDEFDLLGITKKWN